jgi:hypothetical protein
MKKCTNEFGMIYFLGVSYECSGLDKIMSTHVEDIAC